MRQLPSTPQGWQARRLVTRASSQDSVAQQAQQLYEEEQLDRPQRGQGTKLTMLNRYRALVLDSTYQPIGAPQLPDPPA